MNWKYKILKIIPLVGLLIIWELISEHSQSIRFLFSSPLLIFQKLIEKIENGELPIYACITALEALSGLILGIILGSIIGFLLSYNEKGARIAKPYIIAFSAIPIFAIAPMMIIWFGTEIKMKIAMAFFATVFTAISQAYEGGKKVPEPEVNMFKIYKASKKQIFWKMIFPASTDWIIQSLKLNSGLALLGAFLGEFIASDKGLGYAILKASGLYDVTYVLATIIFVISLSLFFNYFIDILEKHKIDIVRKIAR